MNPTVAGILDHVVVPVLVAFLIPFLILLAKAGIEWLRTQTGINIEASVETGIADSIEGAVHFAEERAHDAIVSSGVKVPSSDKLNAAKNFAIAEIQRRNLPAIGAAQVESLVLAAVNKKRAVPGSAIAVNLASGGAGSDVTPTEGTMAELGKDIAAAVRRAT